MKEAVKRVVERAFARIAPVEGWDATAPASLEISVPKDEKFGDFSCNIAMILASRLKSNPRAIATKIAEGITAEGEFAEVTVAGPGFINLRLKPEKWAGSLGSILNEGEAFGKSAFGGGQRVIVEYVSANPTGPLHIGHGRGAAFGDSLSRILSWAGFDTHREYYINDVGLQMDNLGRSTLARARELLGQPFDEPAYKGEYMKDVARDFLKAEGEAVLSLPPEEALAKARKFSADAILEGIKKDLADFRVGFDQWFSENSLHEDGEVNALIEQFLRDGHIYEHEGALWLKTDTVGDDKDRVVKRANGPTTYLAADIAYHKNKVDRGYKTMVDIWGADHHGYVPRLKAVVSALGANPDNLVVRLVQIVNLKRGGELIAMSTRSGVFTTLREIMDEVGADATRYFFLMRSIESQMEFDVDLAKKQSDENPVYYIQYAHARCVNIFVTARERGVPLVPFAQIGVNNLLGEDELRLVKKLLMFPDVVADCARDFQTHPIPQYLLEVAGLFHYFYKHNRVVTEDLELSKARLALVEAARIVFRNGLWLLGVNAPERM
ncbi:MAG: arginine--tRNA ligase [Nitrospinae bacterium]|nr:arginine--tRNA ligase [Nitrospinota bacterium]